MSSAVGVEVHLSFLTDLQVVFQCFGRRPHQCWPPWVAQLVTLWPLSPAIKPRAWTGHASASPDPLMWERVFLCVCSSSTHWRNIWFSLKWCNCQVPLFQCTSQNENKLAWICTMSVLTLLHSPRFINIFIFQWKRMKKGQIHSFCHRQYNTSHLA